MTIEAKEALKWIVSEFSSAYSGNDVLMNILEEKEKVILTTLEAPVDVLCCSGCKIPYGTFPDLVIPDEHWKAISPLPDGGGVLCPTCICRKLEEKGIQTIGKFTSGPLCEAPPVDVEDKANRSLDYLVSMVRQANKSLEPYNTESTNEFARRWLADAEKTVRDALASRGLLGCPEGFVMVPREATDDMMIAFAEVWYSKKRCVDDCEMQDAYEAMIAAATPNDRSEG